MSLRPPKKYKHETPKKMNLRPQKFSDFSEKDKFYEHNNL